MGAADFWFIEMRNQKVNIRRWFLWGILLFIFVTISSYICIKSMYTPIPSFEVNTVAPAIRVEEAKATNANGYVRGTIKNNTSTEINGKYMKFQFFNRKDEIKGTEYVEIHSLNANETKTYEMKFKYDNVKKFVITVVDSME